MDKLKDVILENELALITSKAKDKSEALSMVYFAGVTDGLSLSKVMSEREIDEALGGAIIGGN